ncbi:starch-binding protein [Paenibacillus lautus]
MVAIDKAEITNKLLDATVEIAHNKQTQITTEGGDWYSYTIHGVESARVIFRDGSGKQNPGQNQPGFLRDSDGWYDGAWHGSNPDGEGDQEAPTTPTNLRASAITDKTVTLSWSASTDNVGVISYDIYRDSEKVGSTAETSYTDKGLVPERHRMFMSSEPATLQAMNLRRVKRWKLRPNQSVSGAIG